MGDDINVMIMLIARGKNTFNMIKCFLWSHRPGLNR